MVPFGFINAPSRFISPRNNIFSRYLGNFCLVFLDGILTYSKDEEKHVEQLRLILKLLKKNEMCARLRNYDFYKDGIHYLGHIILDKGIFVDPEKIVAMRRIS